MPELTLAQRLARFAATSTFDTLPPDVVASVRMRVLDILGICVAASPLDTSASARAFVASQAGSPQSTGNGTGRRVPATLGVFLTGVLAHSPH